MATTDPIEQRGVQPKAPAWARFVLRTVGRWNPDWAAWMAYPLIIRPRRSPTPDRERPLLAAARSITLPGKEDGLAGYAWGPKGAPTVVLVHGWSGRAGQLTGFVGPLVDAGYRVVAFDFAGHGQSAGRTTNLREMVTAVRRVVEREAGAVAVVGYSLGGLAALHAVSEGARAEKLVLIGSPSCVETVTDSFSDLLGLGSSVRHRLERLLERRVGVPLAAFDSLAAKWRVKVPALVVHDCDDGNVPLAEAERLTAGWPSARLHLTDGLGHTRVLQDDRLIAKITDFIGPAPAVEEVIWPKAAVSLG